MLAPPGGGSSNIFGGAEPTPVRAESKTQQKPADNQQNILGQPSQNVQERSIRAAPKQGENTFSTLFGKSGVVSTPSSSRSSRNVNTFNNVYGDPDANVNSENKPASHSRNNDSYSRVFAGTDSSDVPHTPKSNRANNSFSRVFGGDGETVELKSQKSPASGGDSFSSIFSADSKNDHVDTPTSRGKTDSFERVFAGKQVNPNEQITCNHVESLSLSDKSLDKKSELSPNKQDTLNSSFNRVFGEFQGDTKQAGVKLIANPSGRIITIVPFAVSVFFVVCLHILSSLFWFETILITILICTIQSCFFIKMKKKRLKDGLYFDFQS